MAKYCSSTYECIDPMAGFPDDTGLSGHPLVTDGLGNYSWSTQLTSQTTYSPTTAAWKLNVANNFFNAPLFELEHQGISKLRFLANMPDDVIFDSTGIKYGVTASPRFGNALKYIQVSNTGQGSLEASATGFFSRFNNYSGRSQFANDRATIPVNYSGEDAHVGSINGHIAGGDVYYRSGHGDSAATGNANAGNMHFNSGNNYGTGALGTVYFCDIKGLISYFGVPGVGQQAFEANAETAHTFNATFDNTELQTAMNNIGAKVNVLFAMFQNVGLQAGS